MAQQRDPHGHHDHGGQEQCESHGAEAGEGHSQTEGNDAHTPALVILEAGAIPARFAIWSGHNIISAG